MLTSTNQVSKLSVSPSDCFRYTSIPKIFHYLVTRLGSGARMRWIHITKALMTSNWTEGKLDVSNRPSSSPTEPVLSSELPPSLHHLTSSPPPPK